jgi:ketosteroid isomerase-like protein
MGENADRLKRGFEAFGSGDLDGASEDWSDDIRWEGTNDDRHDSDDTVIVLGHLEAKAKESGAEVRAPFVHVWRFKDDRATEVLALADTFETAKELGFAE